MTQIMFICDPDKLVGSRWAEIIFICNLGILEIGRR